MKKKLLPAAALGALLSLCPGLAALGEEAPGTLLLRQPTLAREHLAFIYGGDVWVTDRAGQHQIGRAHV